MEVKGTAELSIELENGIYEFSVQEGGDWQNICMYDTVDAGSKGISSCNDQLSMRTDSGCW